MKILYQCPSGTGSSKVNVAKAHTTLNLSATYIWFHQLTSLVCIIVCGWMMLDPVGTVLLKLVTLYTGTQLPDLEELVKRRNE